MDKRTAGGSHTTVSMANTAPAPLETSHNAKPPKPKSIDEMIETYIGGTGAVQLLKAIFVAIAWAFDAQQVFTDAEPGWHCVVGSPGNSSSCSPAAKWPCALPPGTRPRRRWSPTGNSTAPAGRFIAGLARSVIGTCTLVLSTELVGKKWRDAVSVAAFFCYTFGFLSLPALAYALRDASWRSMYLCVSVPCLCYAALLCFLAQESPRWLLVRGRTQEAVDTLRQIASRNGSGTSVATLDVVSAVMKVEDARRNEDDGLFSTLRMMWQRPWALRRLAAIMAAGFGAGTVYFGMPLNVGSLGANLYLSVTYNALAELPSAVMSWLLIARINQRSSVVAFSAAASACSLACLISFFATCTAYNIVLIYAMELFPTSVRSSAVGLVRQAMMLGGVAAPVLVALGRDRRSFLSFGVFGLVIGCSGLFAACLPETRGRSMLDTMEEEEECNEAAVAPFTDTAGATATDLV
ncbi:hypothetical protein EJB05_06285, partial [Eragrostis curvula]